MNTSFRRASGGRAQPSPSGTGPGVQPKRGRLLIVCGLPGSGKTTRARQLAHERNGVRFGPDDWMTALGASLWDSCLRDRVEALQWHVVKEILVNGGTAIIEWGTWGRDERGRLRDEAHQLGAAVELHFLDVDNDELYRRIAARAQEDPPITRDQLDSWHIDRPDPDELASYDPPPPG